MDTTELRSAIEAWSAGDPDPSTRAELEELLRRGATADLEERFARPVGFGTAGLRALIGAGPARMNRAVVRSATAALARWLLATDPSAVQRGVVVARDARRMSAEFASDTAAVLAAAGIPAWVFPSPVPTPLGAFAVNALGAAAGVVVTASHNPADYNGYKVYGPSGAQVIPPDDAAIAAEMARGGPATLVPLLGEADARAAGLFREVGPEVRARYLDAILAERRHPGQGTDLVIAYTAMHGVGGALAVEALRRAGFERVHPVAAQQEPDARFPTVAFPNPEEPGALDLARAAAESVRADLVLANDPDADRLAVMVRGPAGALRQLTGNELGVLLGHYLLTEGPRPPHALVMTTVVSSVQLSHIAARLGVECEETLTGFKWIANGAIRRAAEDGTRFVFGYEEALGYAGGPRRLGPDARDDGGRDAGGAGPRLRRLRLAPAQHHLAGGRRRGHHRPGDGGVPPRPAGRRRGQGGGGGERLRRRSAHRRGQDAATPPAAVGSPRLRAARRSPGPAPTVRDGAQAQAVRGGLRGDRIGRAPGQGPGAGDDGSRAAGGGSAGAGPRTGAEVNLGGEKT
jgi:phosphomannomutase